MHWTAPTEKDAASAGLEKRLWDAVEVSELPVLLDFDAFRRIDDYFQDEVAPRTRYLLLSRPLSGQIDLDDLEAA